MDVSRIRWKQGDYITLGRAVADFNKKIDRLEKMEGLGYLPEKISYQETKEKIYSRKELNRIINSLKAFKKEGAEDLIINQAGTFTTKWEQQQLRKQSKIAIARLNEELATLNTPQESAPFSFAQMGVSRVREIERMKEKIEKEKTETDPEELKRLQSFIKSVGTYDYAAKKAETFRKNYMNMLEKTYINFENYDKFKEKLENIKDPQEFYYFLKQNEKLVDITYMYELARLGIGGASTQQAFNELIKDIGIEIDERKNLKGYRKINKIYFRRK